MAQTVLITGGTSGIGLSLARSFVDRGADVVVCGRSQAALDRFAQDHPQALAVRADVTDPADRRALLQAVADRFGRVDVLVNNAGNFEERDYAAGTNPNATLDDEVALNLTAPIHLTGEVLERWPSPDAIVFITSGFRPGLADSRAHPRRGEGRPARLCGRPAPSTRPAGSHPCPRGPATVYGHAHERRSHGEETDSRTGGGGHDESSPAAAEHGIPRSDESHARHAAHRAGHTTTHRRRALNPREILPPRAVPPIRGDRRRRR